MATRAPDAYASVLRSVKLKIDRAEQHFAMLDAEIQTLIQRHPHGLSDDFYAHPPDGLPGIPAALEPFATASPWIGVLIGDCATNLRAGLDHLTWQVALLNTAAPSKRTQFPIVLERKDYQRAAITMLHDVATQHETGFDRVQPYHRGGRRSISPTRIAQPYRQHR